MSANKKAATNAPVATPPKKRKAPKHAWKPGQSGNPSGRPRTDYRVVDLCRAHTPEAVDTLVTVMRWAKNENARVAASKELLNRGWGCAPQVIDLGDSFRDHGDALLEKLARLLPARSEADDETIHVEHATSEGDGPNVPPKIDGERTT